MIDHALNLIAQRLNQHLKSKFSSDDDLVIIGGLADDNGQRPEFSRNRLLLFVTNIAQDTTFAQDSMRRSVDRPEAASPASMAAQTQSIHLNISIMLASNFDAENYVEGVKVLSQAMAYLQLHANFNPQNTPEMDKSIKKLSLEICDLSVGNSSHLWEAIGRSYMPSILYLMRTVSINADALPSEKPLITAPQMRVAGKAGPS